ncbi:hypothetical protein pipiens_012871 [Culex pipiens pipiens]|uniref:Farnesoic acid O-methyl transferase domain-containing protein n=1 Tax=Culex pipiens pipiens TaxID=38569 RepID=A0ABD1D0M5_CULPP
MWSTAILLTASALLTSAQNDFDAILGCKQYTITGPSYKNPNPYFALDEFQNVLDVEVAGLKIRTIRLGVMGSNDGVIRLAPVVEPYQNTLMDEIEITKNSGAPKRPIYTTQCSQNPILYSGTGFNHCRNSRSYHHCGTGYYNYSGTGFYHYRSFRCIHYSGTGYNNYSGINSISSA